MSNFYDQLCQTFIRPSRQIYNAYDLGQPINKNGKRLDFQVQNNRQHKIMCSFFSNSHHPLAPCLVYLHSLNGSRLESLAFANQALQKGLNFCSFDFSGTGLSQGKYVSLGFFQKFDIQVVLNHLYENFSMNKFVLWGRSMGAAAAIKFISMIGSQKSRKNHYQIKGLVLDSPFHSLSQITIRIAKQRINMPQIFIKVVLMMVKSNIQQKVGFKLSEMQLLEDIKTIKCPVLLLTSKNDKLIDSSQSEKIYQTISHKDREIVFIKGEHNSNREIQTIQYIFKFIAQSIKGNRMGRDPVLVKSSKLLHYRPKNVMGGSYVLSPHSSNKIKNTSFENNKYDTCGDEEIESIRLDEQLTGQSQKGTKFHLPKKQPYLCSPKVKFPDKKYEKVNQNKINFKEKRFNFHQLSGEGEKRTDYVSQKKFQSAQKPCLELNKSPIKEPPKLNMEKRTTTDQSASKTPQKTIQFSSKNYRQKFAQSDKREIKFCPPHANTFHQTYDSGPDMFDINHFNVINQKLKKKKKKSASPMVKVCGAKRNISVSMERKSQLSTKAPPELLKLKYPSKFI